MKFLILFACVALAAGELVFTGHPYSHHWESHHNPWIYGHHDDLAKMLKIDDKFLVDPIYGKAYYGHHYGDSILGKSLVDPLIKYEQPIMKSWVDHAVMPKLVSSKGAIFHSHSMGKDIYGHKEDYQAHEAIQDGAGNKVGSFAFLTPEGKMISTSYVADTTGYHAFGEAIPKDLPEVHAAKIAHLTEVEKIKSRSRRQVLDYSGMHHYGMWGHHYGYPALHHVY